MRERKRHLAHLRYIGDNCLSVVASNMRIVDLRSDTLTLPTEEMLQAIRTAHLGDDCYKEDPTVNLLEEIAAEKMGKEAALLTTSGTQANLVSLMSQTTRGDEVILEAESHIYCYEEGGFSALAGLTPRLVWGHAGVMAPEDVEEVLKRHKILPNRGLICIENTHNRAGGTVWTPSQVRAVHETARTHDLRVHMDGARIFNAAVALDLNVQEFTRHVDTLMFCLSKGLSAPIGSVVVGGQEFIDRARRYRRMLGGGMRQAGIIAAAGIIAIQKMVDRLKEDHANAKLLATGLSRISGISVDLLRVQTNIVGYDVSGLRVDGQTWAEELEKHGVRAHFRESGKVRMVTHRGIEKEDVEYTIDVAGRVAQEIRRKR